MDTWGVSLWGGWPTSGVRMAHFGEWGRPIAAPWGTGAGAKGARGAQKVARGEPSFPRNGTSPPHSPPPMDPDRRGQGGPINEILIPIRVSSEKIHCDLYLPPQSSSCPKPLAPAWDTTSPDTTSSREYSTLCSPLRQVGR